MSRLFPGEGRRTPTNELRWLKYPTGIRKLQQKFVEEDHTENGHEVREQWVTIPEENYVAKVWKDAPEVAATEEKK